MQPMSKLPSSSSAADAISAQHPHDSKDATKKFAISLDNELEENQKQVPQQPYVIQSIPGKGRGLFATRDLPFGFHLHTAPCILISKQEYEHHMRYTVLEEYLFNCPDGDRLLALGHGSLFNHDGSKPNVDYRLDKEKLEINYFIGHLGAKKGEELCIYYGSRDKLWFDDGKANDRSSSESDTGDDTFLDKIDS